jgi:hypothetical protein
LDSHLDFFPDNLGAVSDEHGERFHQDVSALEKRYHGQSSLTMLYEYSWTMKRDVPDAKHRRKYNNPHILSKVSNVYIKFKKRVMYLVCKYAYFFHT